MKAEIIEEKHYYINCPYCSDGYHDITNLMNTNSTFTGWYCENCGGSITITTKNREVEIQKTEEKRIRILVLLKRNELYLIVKGWKHPDIDYRYGFDHHQEYYYNEHTCPTNYLREAEEIIDMNNKDTDPHGLFDYVMTVPYVDTANKTFDELNEIFKGVLK